MKREINRFYPSKMDHDMCLFTNFTSHQINKHAINRTRLQERNENFQNFID